MARTPITRTGVAVCAFLAGTSLAPPVVGQDSGVAEIEEIIVVGTRRAGRTLTNTPVPVDLIQGSEFRSIGSGDMNDMLRTLVPSYNVRRLPLDDEASLVRSPTLRGLPPAFTLTLINGKRFHRSGAVAGNNQGPDLAVIPALAIERAEVLRDGASAQYGSDAIAGVLNFVARRDTEGIDVEYRFGEYYEGDGAENQVGLNWGLPLMGDGFVNFTLEYGNRDPTSRAIQDPVGALLTESGLAGVLNPTQNWGQPWIDDEIKMFVNAAIDVRADGELYGFANYGSRDQQIEFFWRPPIFQDGIYTVGPPFEPTRLVFDVTGDGSGNCPAPGTPNEIPSLPLFGFSQEDFDTDAQNLAALTADPNCWVVNEVYPAGYRPLFGAMQTDYGVVLGYRGERDSGLTYDVSFNHGMNEVDFTLNDSINASMGPASPTDFRPGKTRQTETSVTFDVVRPVDVNAFASPLNIAVGVEWRDEVFEKVAGDTGSWTVGPLIAQGAISASHGFPAYHLTRPVNGAARTGLPMLILETDVTPNLLLGFAVRYEDFEDFGSTTNVKGSIRYAINEAIALRGSASTGFRAPTPAMLNGTNLSTVQSSDGLRQVGLIPPANPVAVFYGGQPLEPEESRNLSLGVALNPLDNLTITVDYFDIEIENRLEIGESFQPTPEDVAALEALGFPGAGSFDEVEFFINIGEYITSGFDIVATYAFEWTGNANSELSLAWNQTEYELSQDDNVGRRRFINSSGVQPDNRLILTFNHTWRNLDLSLRASYFDEWFEADWPNDVFEPVCTDERPNPPGTDHCYGDAWIFDIEAHYQINDRFSVAAGADNVFDETPEFSFLYPDFSRGAIYPTNSPYDYHGGFWFVRLLASF